MPETSSPLVLDLKVWLENRETKIIENDWKIWCFPTSSDFVPSTAIEPAVLLKYLLNKGAGARPRERKMTQYWQLDDEPLESAKYWQEADEYITGTGRFAEKLSNFMGAAGNA